MTTGKVAERDAELAQEIVARLNWMDFESLAPKELAATIIAALATVRQEEREVFSAALVLHLQAKADALDVRQKTERPSGTAFNSEALLRRQIASEVAEIESAARQEK